MIGRVEWCMNVKLSFTEPDAATDQSRVDVSNPDLKELRKRGPPRGEIQAKFYIMDQLADPMILGFPELSTLGCWMEPPGDDGRRWVQFTTMGIRLPIIESKRIHVNTLHVEGVAEIEGPAVASVDVTLTAEQYENAVL